MNKVYKATQNFAGPSSWVGCASTGIQMVAGLTLRSGVIGLEIISTAIPSLPLIHLGHLSVTGKRICTKYWLTT